MAERYTERGAAEAVATWGDVAGEGLALRTYTSRLIGSDPGLVLHGGGNTSVKGTLVDLLGTVSDVLWVKGSGWDLATIEPGGFAPVDLPYVRRLRTLTTLSDEDMVDVLKTRTLSSTAPRPSIETLLHAFLPHRFVDHSHADAILALTNRADGEEVVRRVLGPTVALVPYVKAGFDLAKLAADVFDANPACEGLVLLHHGLFTFGETAEESFRRHVDLVQRAEAYLAEASPSVPAEVAAPAVAPAGRVAGWLRGALARGSSSAPLLAHRADPSVLGALEHARVDHWASTGPLTPDHVIRTKATPLLLRIDPQGLVGEVTARIHASVDDYVQRYETYFHACAGADAGRYTRLDPCPRVVWWPGVGLFASGDTAVQARIVADLACHTLLTKQRAAPLGPYLGLADQHLFDMEYWSLEQAKLGRGAPPALGRRVALVTGGAGAIGVGVARQLLDAGAHVVLTDVDEAGLLRAEEVLGRSEALVTTRLDVTSSDGVRAGFDVASRAFGGVDLVVANAGIAVAGSTLEVDDEAWSRASEVNLGGVQRTVREAATRMRDQGVGGDIVVISTKNVAAPGAGLAAYSVTKAAAHQLARVAAVELAAFDIRVNLVAPDAVFSEGEVPSGLWAELGPDRARRRSVSPESLPEFYRDRNLLKSAVTGSDVGRAVVFFASRHTPTTGAVLPVDGGLVAAFPR